MYAFEQRGRGPAAREYGDGRWLRRARPDGDCQLCERQRPDSASASAEQNGVSAKRSCTDERG